MREGEPRHDSERARKLGAAGHRPASVAHCDKFLARNNKSVPGVETYKARRFNQEPERVPMELTTGTPARKSDHDGMEKHRKTIAIIDDDNGIRQSLKRMLSVAGFSVLMYASAEEFLLTLGDHAVGCAVVDLDLGTMSGLDLASHPAMVASKIPVIFISGTTSETARASAMAIGGVEFLRKPFMPIELLGAIFRATQEPPKTS
jgi:CheY-like chemotaxis protein